MKNISVGRPRKYFEDRAASNAERQQQYRDNHKNWNKPKDCIKKQVEKNNLHKVYVLDRSYSARKAPNHCEYFKGKANKIVRSLKAHNVEGGTLEEMCSSHPTAAGIPKNVIDLIRENEEITDTRLFAFLLRLKDDIIPNMWPRYWSTTYLYKRFRYDSA